MPWISLAEVRAQDFKNPPYSDDAVNTAIAEVEAYVQRLLGNWFDPRTLTLKLDGSGRDTLLLSFPIISISSITINGATIAPTSVVVYNRHLSGMLRPDDRQNPKLVFATPTQDIRSGRCWTRGNQNVVVTGSFGYRDYDAGDTTGQIPPALKRALYLLLPRFLETAGGPYAKEANRFHEVIENKTRGQSAQYQETHGALTGNPVVDRLLAPMRAPMSGGVA